MCLESFLRNMKFDENYFYHLVITSEKLTKSWFFGVLDMPDLQSAQNDSKNYKNENLIFSWKFRPRSLKITKGGIQIEILKFLKIQNFKNS